MGGFGHSVTSAPEPDDIPTSTRNARWGMQLFIIYLVLYAGFVLINAFAPAWLDIVVVGGLNLAVAYGLALIGAAVGLALLYAWMCRNAATPSKAGGP